VSLAVFFMECRSPHVSESAAASLWRVSHHSEDLCPTRGTLALSITRFRPWIRVIDKPRGRAIWLALLVISGFGKVQTRGVFMKNKVADSELSFDE